MAKLLVIADDLSGATDVGVQFAKQGIRAIVTLGVDTDRSSLSKLFASFEIVLIDLASRHVEPDEAARRVHLVATAARTAGIEKFYKKTDSTLRGNVGAELAALLQATGQRTICFVPAHPVLGRTTRGGCHFVYGTPLHQSAFATDLRNPMLESRIAVVLARQTGLPITLIGQETLKDVGRALPLLSGIVVFDAETEDDLWRIVRATKSHSTGSLLAGSAAFAACLPALIDFPSEKSEPIRLSRQLLVVNGSVNDVALRQCTVAHEQGFSFVALTPQAALADDTAGETEFAAIANRIVEALNAGRSVIFSTVQSQSDFTRFNEVARNILPNSRQWPDRIALRTGRLVKRILARRRSNFGLVVFGGDTFAGVAHANQWRGLIPRTEVLPGLAACEVAEEPGRVVISKPGGFGEEDVLLKLQEGADC